MLEVCKTSGTGQGNPNVRRNLSRTKFGGWISRWAAEEIEDFRPTPNSGGSPHAV
jgi:hypothetical protein